MPLTQHELELKKTASERIRRRLLPAEAPKTIWAGPGTGKTCSLCDRAVDSTEPKAPSASTSGAMHFGRWNLLAWRRTCD
jgi:hypothetical protein